MGAEPVHRSTMLRGVASSVRHIERRSASRPNTCAVSGRGIRVGAWHFSVSGPKSVEPAVRKLSSSVRPT